MNATDRRSFVTLVAGGALGGLCVTSRAQASRETVRVFCGFPAGGSADVVSRVYAEGLRNRYAKSGVVENRPGAGGRLAVQAIKSSPPDGANLLLSPTSIMTLYPHVYRKPGFDAQTDVVPVAPVARFAFCIATRNDLPIRNLPELGAWAKANADKATYGIPAAGSSPHFLGQILGDALGCTLTHVPYRGTGPAMQDLIGGNLAFVVSTVGDLVPNHKGARLRVVGVSSEQRLAALPDIATFREQGVERGTLYESFAMFAPPGTPAATVQQANAALKAASVEPSLVESLARLEIQAEHEDSAAFVARLRRETTQWGPIVKASGFQIDE